jgi:hypothetical protein
MLRVFVKAEPGSACATFEIEPGGQETGSPGLKRGAAPDSLRGSGNNGERRGFPAVCRDYFRPVSSHCYHYVDPELLEGHLRWLTDAGVKENPFFVPPDQLLLEIRERQAIRRSASMAR